MTIVALKASSTTPTSSTSSAAATGPTALPPADATADPLALIYASSLVQQSTTASSDAAREKVDTDLRDNQLKEQKKELDEKDEGGRGFFGAITHLIGDAASDVVHLNAVGLVKDAGHDVSHDMINNPTFWNQLKDGAEVVGVAAAATASIVATGGASTPVLVAVSLSAAAMLDSKAHILQKLGVSAGVAGWVDAGVGLAAAAVTLGASLTSTASTLSTTAQDIKTGATVISGTSHVTNAAATVSTSVLAKHNDDLDADAQRASNQARQLQQTVDWLLDGMKETQKSNQRVLSTVQQAMQTQQTTSTTLSSFGKA